MWNSKHIILVVMMPRKQINNVEQPGNDDQMEYTIELTTRPDVIMESISEKILSEERPSCHIS